MTKNAGLVLIWLATILGVVALWGAAVLFYQVLGTVWLALAFVGLGIIWGWVSTEGLMFYHHYKQ